MRLRSTLASILLALTTTTLHATANAYESHTTPLTSENLSYSPSNARHITITTDNPNEKETYTTPSGNQFNWLINSGNDRHEKTFSVESDGDTRLKLDQNTGSILIEVDGTPEALVEVPWATDSAGNEINTHFTINGNNFTQHVNPTSEEPKYPIIADPRVNWGIVSGHIYFSKEETKKLGAGSAAAFAVTPFWLLVPPPFGEAIGTWWGYHAADITVWASAAAAQDKCLALKIGATGPSITKPAVGVNPEHYTEGCH